LCGIAQGLVRIQHLPGVLLLLFIGRSGGRFALEQFALRRRVAVRMDAKDLVQTETVQEVAAALAATDNVEMSVSKLFQAQSHARHCPHEGGIHHGAFFQVDDEFAIAAIDHLAGEFLEVAAIEEAALAFHFHPNGFAVYSDLN
jgi:hypothetical protein